MCCLCKVAGIKWQDTVLNTEVSRICGIQGIETFLLQTQFHWIGHVIQMSNDRIPKQVFFGQLAAGKRFPGGPIRHYKDSLEENLKKCGFQPKSLCEESLDCDSCCSQCKEASRIVLSEMKRAAHKQSALPSMNVAV